MISAHTIKYEIDGRINELDPAMDKFHISVRWEPAPRIARIGLMLSQYDWEERLRALRLLRAFEADHADEFATEFDILPLEAVTDFAYAEV